MVGLAYSHFCQRIVLKNLDVSLSWKANHDATLRCHQRYRSHMCGLCGDFDDDQSNDFIKPDGSSATSPAEFGNSWKTADGNPERCEDDRGVSPCDAVPLSTLNSIQSYCNSALTSIPFDVCNEKVPETTYLDNCEVELCDCFGDRRCICTTLETYSSACALAGVDINPLWRKEFECERPCTFHNRMYSPGSEWTHNNEECRCDDGTVNCERIPCEEWGISARYGLSTGYGTVSADSHYMTYDGRIFSFYGTCRYILSEDCSNSSTYSIETEYQQIATGERSQLNSVYITFNRRKVRLGRNHNLQIDGEQVSASYTIKDCDLNIWTERSTIYVYSVPLAIRVSWTDNEQLVVELPTTYRRRVCGLLGNYDNNPTNDLMTPSGLPIASPAVFGNRWVVPGYESDGCVDAVDENVCEDKTENEMTIIRNRCSVIQSRPFSVCESTVSPEPYLTICENLLCSGSTLCTAVNIYTRRCRRHGVEINDTEWTRNERCLSPCIYNNQLYEAGSTWISGCQQCRCDNGITRCGGDVCTVVPPGICHLWGDPHYTSFDGRKFDFQGDCRYVLAEDCVNNTFGIYIIQTKTSPVSSVSVSSSFHIEVNNRVVDLWRNHELHVDGTIQTVPYNDVDISASVTSNTITVILKNLDVSLSWKANHDATLRCHQRYRSHMCGLCGDFDDDQSNDFIKPDGSSATSPAEFGNSWKTPTHNLERCDDDPGISPCEWLSQYVYGTIQSYCESTLRSSPFNTCHGKVDVIPYFDNCEVELCDCSGDRSCICTTLEAYSSACASVGVDLNPLWRTEYKCERPCTFNYQIYSSGANWTYNNEECYCDDGSINCQEIPRREYGISVRYGSRTGYGSVSANSYYTSYDGRRFRFDGSCRYILSEDCDPVGRSFRIETEHRGTRTGNYEVNSLYICINIGVRRREVTISRNHVLQIDGREISSHYSYRDCDINVWTNMTTIYVYSVGLEIRVSWTHNDHIAVELPESYQRRVCGLLGNYDNSPNNDRRTPTGLEVLSPSTFGNRWRVPGYEAEGCRDATDENPCDQVTREELSSISQRCSILSSSPFDVCSTAIVPESYIRDCMSQLCSGLSICAAVETYVRECRRNGVDINDSQWLTAENCLPNCIYESRIYAPDESWNSSPNLTCKCENGCATCIRSYVTTPRTTTTTTTTRPIDYAICTMWGDPHYTSFDGTRFDFQGDCTYLLSVYCDAPNEYLIEVTHELTRPTSTVSTTKSFRFTLPGLTIDFERNHLVKINSSAVVMPYSDTNVQISVVGPTVHLTIQSPRMKFSWTSNHHGILHIEKDPTKQTCGLCGDYQTPSFRKRDGTTTTSEPEFGNSWKVSPSPTCTDDAGIYPCLRAPDSDNGQAVRAFCASAIAVIRVSNLSACVQEHFMEHINDMCVVELCDCGRTAQCLCNTLQAIIGECRLRNYSLQQSLLKDFNCALSCYRDGKEYQDKQPASFSGEECVCETGTFTCVRTPIPV